MYRAPRGDMGDLQRYVRRIQEVHAIQLIESPDDVVAKGIADLADGVEGVDDQGIYVCLRIGPFSGFIMREGDYLIVDEERCYPCPGAQFDRDWVLPAVPRPTDLAELARKRAIDATLQRNATARYELDQTYRKAKP